MQGKAKRPLSKAVPWLTLCAPFFICLAFFVIFPLLASFFLSFFSDIQCTDFVGLTHFHALIKSDAFVLAVKNTCFFYVIALPLVIVLPLIFANFFYHTASAQKILKFASFYHIILPAASIMLFCDLLFADGGLLAEEIASLFSLSTSDLYQTPFSFFLLVGLFVLKYGGYNFLLFSAAMSRIPRAYYEEAQICGASARQCFRLITLPSLKGTLLLSVILSVVNSYKIYREAYLMGGYYPHKSMYLIQHYIHNNYQNMNFSRLCAVTGVILGCLIAACGLVLFIGFLLKRITDRRGHYE